MIHSPDSSREVEGSTTARVGVLVMAHGTPRAPEEIEAFYTRIRRGNPPSREQLEELTARYDAIGGVSPLAAITRAQVAGLTDLLDADSPRRYLVRYGAKHTAPLIEDAALELIASGVDRIVGLVLTPHYCAIGAGEYLERARSVIEESDRTVSFAPIDHWYESPSFVDLIASFIKECVCTLDKSFKDNAVTVFTAHSIPTRVAESKDPYFDQVFDSASLVAKSAGIDRWTVAWQSAGRTRDPWLSPDLSTTLRALADGGVGACVLCPIGFVSDHLEVLYDLDVEAANAAKELGVEFRRTKSLNDDPRFLRVLADAVGSAGTLDG